ncbi:hypothetical protein [Undibacterium umbellatum]|uniref:Uncharacterized protein n=1 Tax=Undibacterium umbellatum TaxID=2762300 RepID=A0ABR6Z3D2_9BURK|nr:hypothetical protein [Undibacterium umbellatum]MBC3906237.1 hypothetical protein [Undibacterium umbellatum]
MNTQTPFNLAPGHFAQPAVDSKPMLINGQNLIDAFAQCGMEQCEKMAAMLDQGRYENFGRMMFKVMREWSEAT